MSANHKKVKMLLVGSVKENFSTLQKKLTSLQSSKAGPFDICFCVGPIQIPDNFNTPLPLPVFLQESSSNGKDDNTSSNDNNNGIIDLGNNLYTFDNNNQKSSQSNDGPPGVPIFDIPIPVVNNDGDSSTSLSSSTSLRVALCPRNVRATNNKLHQSSSKQQQHCDLLLSTDWPQGMDDVLQVETEPMSYDVGEIALVTKPRYHVAPSSQYYHQSPPYDMGPQSQHVCRFLALAPVGTTKPTKTTKFIHALGLVPLSANPPPTTAPSTLPCPFLSSGNTSATSNSNNNTNITPPPPPQRRPPAFAMQAANIGPAYSRFGNQGGHNKRRNNDHNNDNSNQNNNSDSLHPPDDPNIKTLFLYGLHKDVTGELQSTRSSKVLFAFQKYGIEKVRHPPNTTTTTYCFLEFPNQDKALQCLLECHGRINIDGVDLTLKWATENKNHQNKRQRMMENAQHQREKHYVTHDEAPDSITLYFHPPKGVEFNDEFANSVQQHLQKTLEDALNDGTEEERVTAETEPALAIKVRTKDAYGFLEFASHAAATMALAAVTKSTDGGIIVATDDEKSDDKNNDDDNTKDDETNGPKPIEPMVGTTLRWAKGEMKKTRRDEVLEALGLKRQYYPADSRTDCWFCLASPTCETHLIVGVYDEWYMTLPKGPVHPGHVLLVPVEHTHQGSWTLSSSSQEEWTGLVTKLHRHAVDTYEDMDLFVFERAMMTKGNYHSHIQCVPIPKDCSSQLRSTMMAHSKASGFELRQIQSDLSIGSMLSADDSYFYAEIVTGTTRHRFLYKQPEDNDNSLTVPLQFAREVLAAVLKDPKLAHWKACVVDKDEETKMASDFRKSFASLAL